jgi:hypothetical protein
MRRSITALAIPVISLWLLGLSCASALVPAGLTGSTPRVDACRAGMTCAISGEASTRRVDDKRREPKPDSEDGKKREPKSDENKDDDDTLGACLGILDCISGGLDMIAGISELFGDDNEPKPAKTWEKGSFEGPDEFVTFEGVIEPMNPLAETVEIWSVAGGSTSGGEVLSEVPRGTKLSVVGRSYRLNNYWLCVCPTHRDDLYGWIREENLTVVPGSETGDHEAEDQ